MCWWFDTALGVKQFALRMRPNGQLPAPTTIPITTQLAGKRMVGEHNPATGGAV